MKRPYVKRLLREIEDSKQRGGMIAGWPRLLVKRIELEQVLHALELSEQRVEELSKELGEALHGRSDVK